MKTGTQVNQSGMAVFWRLIVNFSFTVFLVGASTIVAGYYGPMFFHGILHFMPPYGMWLVGMLGGMYTAVLCLIVFLFRRWKDACLRNLQLEQKNQEHLKVLAEVRQIRGCLPICASCKKVRDAVGEWHCVTDYLHDRLGTRFTHGVCPECSYKLYPLYADQMYPLNGTTVVPPEVLQGDRRVETSG